MQELFWQSLWKGAAGRAVSKTQLNNCISVAGMMLRQFARPPTPSNFTVGEVV
jgi:hypothetical protein